jgi:hypothetical protein
MSFNSPFDYQDDIDQKQLQSIEIIYYKDLYYQLDQKIFLRVRLMLFVFGFK